jgi:hypothetical protein
MGYKLRVVIYVSHHIYSSSSTIDSTSSRPSSVGLAGPPVSLARCPSTVPFPFPLPFFPSHFPIPGANPYHFQPLSLSHRIAFIASLLLFSHQFALSILKQKRPRKRTSPPEKKQTHPPFFLSLLAPISTPPRARARHF